MAGISTECNDIDKRWRLSAKMSTSTEPGRKAPYLTDLRLRIVWLRLSMELSYRKITKKLCIAVSTTSKSFECFSLTGDVEYTRQPSRPHVIRIR